MLEPEPNAAYESRYRVTDTNRGFGNQRETSVSYRATDPSEVIDLIDKDLADLRTCVKDLGRAKNKAAKNQEIKSLIDSINNKVSTANEYINSKRGEDTILVNRLKTRVDKAEKEKEKILKDYSKKKKMEGATSETNVTETNVTETNVTVADSFLPSSGGEDAQDPNGVDQEVAQVQDSALEQRVKEKDAIRDLERDMNDLKDIHVDLNVHIHEQGDGVDRIELQTESSAHRVSKGVDNTKQAVELKDKNRRVIWVIIAIGASIITIVIIIIIILAIVLGTAND